MQAPKDTGVVFLLDEVQFADETHYRSVITALHRATQKNLPITLAAAGLPQIPRLTGEARSYAERLFTFPVIANLPEADATAALVEPARQQQVAYEPEALALALTWTGGYPFYIRQLDKHRRRVPHHGPVVEAAMPAASGSVSSFDESNIPVLQFSPSGSLIQRGKLSHTSLAERAREGADRARTVPYERARL